MIEASEEGRTDRDPGAAVVIGAGAIGLVLTAALQDAGLEVAVLGGTPVDRLVLLDGERTLERPLRHLPVWDGKPRTGPVIVAVKAQHTAAVGPLIAAAAPSASAVVVAQNGIEQTERVRPFVGGTPVVPLLAWTPAERTGPGRVLLRRPPGADAVLPDDAAAREVAALLRAGGLRVETEPDFRTAAWRKLLLNLTSMTTTTLTRRGTEVVRDPAVAATARRLLEEAARIARADGAAIAADEPAAIIGWLQSLPEGSTTSMLTDLLAGRDLEVDAVHGAALRAAARTGEPAPLLASVTALIAAAR